jgi:cobalt-zinc-cadmium efflux system membrane fusion protein
MHMHASENYARRPRHGSLVRIALRACAALPLACVDADAADATASTAPPATVELSAGQAAAVAVATLGTHAFPIVRDEIGAIAAPEDLAVIQAESALLAAASADTVATGELARATTLAVGDGVSRRELEQAAADRTAADAALAAARAALRALGVADAQMQRLLGLGQVDEATLPGERWVGVAVLEADAPLIRVGQAAEVRVAAFPGSVFAGAVRRAYASVDPLLHRMTARVAVADPAGELLPGMLAEVRITIRAPLVAPAIPERGVVREGDGSWTAWTTSDGRRCTQRAIQPGMRDGAWVQVVSGLALGERVVSDGALMLDNMLSAGSGD